MDIQIVSPFGELLRGSDEAMAFDLRSNISFTLGRGQGAVVPTGVYIAMPPGYGCFMRERSGLAVKGIRLGGGTIDSDYRGEWKVILRYEPVIDVLKPLADIPDQMSINIGDRICQLVFLKHEVVKQELLSMDEFVRLTTKRGEGGFGSTGMS